MNMDIIWILLATIIAICPTILIKEYTISDKTEYLIYALLLYICLICVYVKIYKDAELSNIYTILQISQIIVIILFGIVMYNEKINANKIIGISLGMSSIYYLYKP
jgi:multidrug transporter EmrE-like cation transporter